MNHLFFQKESDLTASYIPLHLHTVYSTMDGAIKISDLIDKCKELGIPSCAITDHGNMGGIVKFYKEATKKGIKPIIGCEAYTTNDPDGIDKQERTRDNNHLVLLAKDNIGLEGLFKLSYEANKDNFYYKPRIYLPKLKEYKGHFVGLSACLGSVLKLTGEFVFDQDTNIYQYKKDGVESILEALTEEYFDLGDFYLELQDTPEPEQIAWNDLILEWSEDYNIPLVVTTDAHYLTLEDREIHEIMMALQLKKTLDEYRKGDKMIYGPYYYIKSPEEIITSSKKLTGGIEPVKNTIRIAEKCNVSMNLEKYFQPTYK